MKMKLMVTVAVGAFMAFGGQAFADMAAAEKWVDDEFQPSTLSRAEQMAEMEWFHSSRGALRGHGYQCAVGRYSDTQL